jgi:hypothetical protein
VVYSSAPRVHKGRAVLMESDVVVDVWSFELVYSLVNSSATAAGASPESMAAVIDFDQLAALHRELVRRSVVARHTQLVIKRRGLASALAGAPNSAAIDGAPDNPTSTSIQPIITSAAATADADAPESTHATLTFLASLYSIDPCRILFDQLRVKLAPDTVQTQTTVGLTLRRMLRAQMSQAVDFNAAERVVEQAEDAATGSVADIDFYHSWLALARTPQQAEHVVSRLESAALEPNLDTYLHLVLLYMRHGAFVKIDVLLAHMDAGAEVFRVDHFETIIRLAIERAEAQPDAHDSRTAVAIWTARAHQAGMWDALHADVQSAVLRFAASCDDSVDEANARSIDPPGFRCCMADAGNGLGGFFRSMVLNRAHSCDRFIQCQTAAAAAASVASANAANQQRRRSEETNAK